MSGIHQPEDLGVLRFITAGSVDDGKSTLIGRLLYDSKAVLSDQLSALSRAKNKRTVGDEIDLSLLTDGLEAEREQGITIDVAYRYFATAKRKFIIADTPGHEQYTRNMVTGASTADLGLVLVDARHGLTEQSRRHTVLLSLLQVPHITLVVNKMDLVDYDESVYTQIREDFLAFTEQLRVPAVATFPISALVGDNVVETSDAMPWYTGTSLLEHLETAESADLFETQGDRFPVQYVIRPQQGEHRDGIPNRSLGDFIAPKQTGLADHVGAFAVTAGLGSADKITEFKADHDDYSAILLESLADRLAEAFAERMHQRVRQEFWGYQPDEQLDNQELIGEKYVGIRPAPGYPACPEHSLKPMLFDMLGAGERAGLVLTESFAMLPTAAVSRSTSTTGGAGWPNGVDRLYAALDNPPGAACGSRAARPCRTPARRACSCPAAPG